MIFSHPPAAGRIHLAGIELSPGEELQALLAMEVATISQCGVYYSIGAS